MSQERLNGGTPVSAAQVLRRLADIEGQGIQFYEGLRDGTESEWVRKLAHAMSLAEKRHRERFIAYAQKAEEENDPENNALSEPLPEEIVRLLTAPVFVPKARVEKSAKYSGDREMLKLAIHLEESLALLMAELRQYVPQEQRVFIDRVSKEEWNHKAKLESVMREHLGV